MKLVLAVAIRPAERYDLPQLEWYGHQRHLRPHIEEVLDRRERGEAEGDEERCYGAAELHLRVRS